MPHARLDLLEKLFPFYFILDRELNLLHAGVGLKKIIGDETQFQELFEFQRPGIGITCDFDSIVTFSEQIFLLRFKKFQSFKGILKGQFVIRNEHELIFAGSPWVNSESVMKNMGLKIADFAIHDSMIDVLQLINAHQLAGEDLQLYTQMLQQKNHDLQKLNTELDYFVYSVSHDLRSPLLSIKGILNLILHFSDEINEEVKTYLKLIERSINRLDTTIIEILDYSKNSRNEVKTEPFDVKEVVENIVEDIKYAVGVPFHFYADYQLDSVIIGDRARLNTVLRNVITNSVKYRNKSQAEPWVKFELYKSKQRIYMRVSDNGQGIQEEYKVKVFDMFFRGTSEVVGSGLGLFIVKEIIHKIGGTIELDSAVNKGTTMTLSIPDHSLSQK